MPKNRDILYYADLCTIALEHNKMTGYKQPEIEPDELLWLINALIDEIIKLRASELPFSDDELYVIKRTFVESSYEFFMSEDKYTEEERKLHTKLTNYFLEQIALREQTKEAKNGNTMD